MHADFDPSPVLLVIARLTICCPSRAPTPRRELSDAKAVTLAVAQVAIAIPPESGGSQGPPAGPARSPVQDTAIPAGSSTNAASGCPARSGWLGGVLRRCLHGQPRHRAAARRRPGRAAARASTPAAKAALAEVCGYRYRAARWRRFPGCASTACSRPTPAHTPSSPVAANRTEHQDRAANRGTPGSSPIPPTRRINLPFPQPPTHPRERHRGPHTRQAQSPHRHTTPLTPNSPHLAQPPTRPPNPRTRRLHRRNRGINHLESAGRPSSSWRRRLQI